MSPSSAPTGCGAKSSGRRERSGAMMTQRPVIGSRRSSDIREYSVPRVPEVPGCLRCWCLGCSRCVVCPRCSVCRTLDPHHPGRNASGMIVTVGGVVTVLMPTTSKRHATSPTRCLTR